VLEVTTLIAMKAFCFAVSLQFLSTMANTQPAFEPQTSFEDFKQLLLEVEGFRNQRLLSLDTFLSMSTDANTIILDSRSDFRFDRKHVAHAKHLSFPDYTQENLEKLIPNKSTRILIYCNNNFTGDGIDFATKVVVAPPGGNQFTSQQKPTMLALNIPTFITLYGYGYKNIFELGEVLDVKDPRLVFEGSVVHPGIAPGK
jgi:hypothetical protein